MPEQLAQSVKLERPVFRADYVQTGWAFYWNGFLRGYLRSHAAMPRDLFGATGQMGLAGASGGSATGGVTGRAGAWLLWAKKLNADAVAGSAELPPPKLN